MKALVATFLAAGVSLTTLSSAQAITVTVAPLAGETSSVVQVQANRAGGCERGYQMTPRGCQEIIWNYKKPAAKKKKKQKHRT